MNNNLEYPIFVADCPRCNSDKITFDVLSYNNLGTKYDWQRWYELFCICRYCQKATTFKVSQRTSDYGVDIYTFRDPANVMKFKGALNKAFNVEGYINISDNSVRLAPEYVPSDVKKIFEEGTACISIKCWNAAGAMFRQCLDMVSKTLLPQEENEILTNYIRSKLGPRLNWLFEKGYIAKDLEGLAECVREDGNDAAHDGSLKEADALDLLDFAEALLQRIYTEPKRIEQAKERRTMRRQPV